jgi:hypothetical protein
MMLVVERTVVLVEVTQIGHMLVLLGKQLYHFLQQHNRLVEVGAIITAHLGDLQPGV